MKNGLCQEDILITGLKRYIPQPLLDHFASLQIGIIGCGGLGSNCAFMLARSGFRNFFLVDGDTVEPSNLNRQMFFPGHIGMNKAEALKNQLLTLSPNLNIKIKTGYYEPQKQPDLFAECRFLVEAVDKADIKSAILNHCQPYNSWITSASGLGHWTCLDGIETKIMGGVGDSPVLALTGDRTYGSDPLNPPLAPGVMTTAAAQVHALMKQAIKESGYEWK